MNWPLFGGEVNVWVDALVRILLFLQRFYKCTTTHVRLDHSIEIYAYRLVVP